MKKSLLISGVLLALTATVASAAGINLSWVDCGAAGQANMTFACAANTGNEKLVLSYDVTGLTVSAISGVNTIVDLQTLNPITASASWWDMFNTGTCRGAVLVENLNYPGAACTDYWGGNGAGAITAYINTGANRRRIGGSWSIGDLFSGTPGETYAMVMQINNTLTVGACNPGCLEPACIVFNEILISQPVGTPGGSPVVNNPLQRNWVTWQGGAIGNPGCPAATPTINRTWGQVKSIYR